MTLAAVNAKNAAVAAFLIAAMMVIITLDVVLRNLGFQIRYRYELAPLSNLYIAYVRGGFGFNDFSQGVGPLLGDSFSLHDSEQLLVKLSYRFEL